MGQIKILAFLSAILFITYIIAILYNIKHIISNPISFEIDSPLNPIYLWQNFISSRGKVESLLLKVLLISTITFGAIYTIIPYTPFGAEKIDALLEKRFPYNTYYYISLASNEKYQAIAKIKVKGGNNIIQEAYINGESVKFSDLSLPNDSLEFGELINIKDDEGNLCRILLLDYRPNNEQIKDLP